MERRRIHSLVFSIVFKGLFTAIGIGLMIGALAVMLSGRNFIRNSEKDRWVGNTLSKRYPEAGKAMLMRAETYNSQIRGMERYEKEGKLLVIAPDDTCGVTTLKHRDEDIMRLYDKGYKDAEKILPFLGI